MRTIRMAVLLSNSPAHEKLWLESDRRWTKKLTMTDWGAVQEALQKANFWTTTD